MRGTNDKRHPWFTIKPVPMDQLPEGCIVRKFEYKDGPSLAAEAARAAGTVDIREHTPSQIGTDDSQERKDTPMARGLLDYFPAALAAVAQVSKVGNDKHNPGEDMHHARGKSMDHADCIVRHLADRGGFDDQGVRHSAYTAWRALALLQQELEDAGAPPARAARFPTPTGDLPVELGPPAAQVPPATIELVSYDEPAAACDRYGEVVVAQHLFGDRQTFRIVDYRSPEEGELYVNKYQEDLVMTCREAALSERYIVEVA